MHDLKSAEYTMMSYAANWLQYSAVDVANTHQDILALNSRSLKIGKSIGHKLIFNHKSTSQKKRIFEINSGIGPKYFFKRLCLETYYWPCYLVSWPVGYFGPHLNKPGQKASELYFPIAMTGLLIKQIHYISITYLDLHM